MPAGLLCFGQRTFAVRHSPILFGRGFTIGPFTADEPANNLAVFSLAEKTDSNPYQDIVIR